MKRIYEFKDEEVARILGEHLRTKGEIDGSRYALMIEATQNRDKDGFSIKLEAEKK